MLKLPWAPGEREFDFACEDVCPLWLVAEGKNYGDRGYGDRG
ncbi:hypothetical protein L917_03659, partial [Phytophthora nicotianae]